MMTFHSKEIDFLVADVLKCGSCGYEIVDNPEVEYSEKSRCPECHDGQMMGWAWGGWKENPIRKKYWDATRALNEVKGHLSVHQGTQPLRTFSKAERVIGKGLIVVMEVPCEAPVLSGVGAGSCKIYGMRRRGNNLVEFGIGTETDSQILEWVTADDFYDEWPQ